MDPDTDFPRPADLPASGSAPGAAPAADRPDLPPAALRALAEAEARRRAAGEGPARPPELGGRDGPEPVRYGDWELKGLAIDF